jgi:aldehyde dehydrogenase (NAD+)
MMTFILIGALSSELAPHSALLLTKLIPQYLDNSCFRVVNGAVEVATALLEHPYGHILYTGAGPVGSIVMAAASKYLTPVTLELGGKSPVIVTAKADVALAAKRIAWGKFSTRGKLACVLISHWWKRALCQSP